MEQCSEGSQANNNSPLLLPLPQSKRSGRMLLVYHDTMFLLASKFSLVHVVVTVALVVFRYLLSLELAEFLQRARFNDHALKSGRFLLRAIKHVRRVFVVHDRFA